MRQDVVGDAVNGKVRNFELDFWKFIAAIFVVLVHSYSLFDGEFLVASQGRLAVEFFFLVTGFLFAHSIIRDKRSFSLETIGSETWHFLWRKMRSFLPFYVIGFAFAWCGLLLLRRGGCGSYFAIINVPFDFLLLRETGFPIWDVFGVDWYLSTMLITLFLLYPVFRCRKMFFSYWIAPFLAMFCYGILFMHGGHLNYGWRCNDFVIIKPNLIRAIAGICLGVTAYRVSTFLRNNWTSRSMSVILSVVSACAMFFACGLMLVLHADQMQHVVLSLFFVFVCISGSGVARSTTVYSRFPKVCSYLGTLSLSLFLMHSSARWFVLYAAKHCDFLGGLLARRDMQSVLLSVSIYVGVSLLLAILAIPVCRPFQKWLMSFDGSDNKKGESAR